MTSSFVPFVPAAKAVVRSAAPPAFAPLVANSSSVPPEKPEATPEARSAVPGAEPCVPKVSVEREADRITRIRIHCSCGELIELDCQY